MIVIPAITFAVRSFAAASALTPALPASILLCPRSATWHAPNSVALASKLPEAETPGAAAPAA